MASVKSITGKRKKRELKPLPQRKSNVARLLEEKHIGSEITDWSKVTDVDKAMMECLRHYGYFYDNKEAFKWGETWVKKNRTAKELADYQAAKIWLVSTTIGGLAKMHTNGAPLEEKYMKSLNAAIDIAIKDGAATRAITRVPSASVKTAIEILAEKTSDFIAKVEWVVDQYISGAQSEIQDYSVYDELKKINAPKTLVQKVIEYYTPLLNELEELVTRKTPDLLEGYKHLKTVPNKRDYLAFIKNIIDECQKFLNASVAAKVRAVRQPRVKKKIPVEKLVARVKYQKESNEYKLTSINPVNIIGALDVYLFNTKYRRLVQLVAASVEGFSIKGTTIINISDTCSSKTLRKPEDALMEFGKATKARASKMFIDLKTKAGSANGRLNEETIILKVYK